MLLNGREKVEKSEIVSEENGRGRIRLSFCGLARAGSMRKIVLLERW